MALHSLYFCLFLTILGGSISTALAQESTECSNGISRNICETIDEFIRSQIQDIVGARLATIDQSTLEIDKDIRNTANKITLQIIQDINQITNKINTAFVEAELLKSTETTNNNGTEDQCRLFNVPASIKTSNNIWKNREKPTEDDLDTYLNTTKGCEYHGIGFYRDSYYFPEQRFNGTPIETHFAIRTRQYARVMVWWKPEQPGDYIIAVGDDNNRNTKLIDHADSSKMLLVVPTPGILSEYRYDQFYVKIDNDTLTFGKKCAPTPIFTYNITITERDTLYMGFESYATNGGKIMHHCPANV